MRDRSFPTRFAHHRLDAYRVAFELFEEVEALARCFPRGHRDLKDQLRRAAASTVRNLAEGANRRHPKDKAARFLIACGEVGETDVALAMVAALGLAPADRVRRLRILADRTCAMLWGLIHLQERRFAASVQTRAKEVVA